MEAMQFNKGDRVQLVRHLRQYFRSIYGTTGVVIGYKPKYELIRIKWDKLGISETFHESWFEKQI